MTLAPCSCPLPRRALLALGLLAAAPAPARAGGGFNDPALIARLLPSVVALTVIMPAPTRADPRAEKREHASGFVVDPRGLIMTSRHAVAHARRIRVRLADGTMLPARVVLQAPIDLALLRVDAARPLPAVRWADHAPAQPGEGVIVIGNPLGIGLSVSVGVVSAVGRRIPAAGSARFIQTDAALNRGNSGGPLFDFAGRVIGVATGELTPKGDGGSIGIGLALPAAAARAVLTDYAQARRSPRSRPQARARR